MPRLLPGVMVDRRVNLHYGRVRSLWLEGVRYEIPTYETVELFAGKLLRNGVVSKNDLIDRLLEGQMADLSMRSAQRYFAQTVGLTRKFIEQIKRAQIAEELLKAQGAKLSLSIVAAQAGYADHAHMTRSFKLLYGRTPSQLVRSG